MQDPKERLTTCVSTAELERRWKASREMMREHGLDYLLMRQDEEFLGSYVRWFSDFSARHSYPFTVIFPVDEEMTLITVGGTPPADPYPPAWSTRGVKRRLGAPYFESVHYTSTYDAQLAADVLKEKPKAVVGLVGRSYIPITFFEHLQKELPGHTFVDATEWIDQIKIIKSPEEIELIKGTAALQDIAIEHVRKTLRPGRHDFEMLAEAQYSVVTHGSERQLILTGSAPKGTPATFNFRHFQNRVIQEGDQFSILIEVNGPGGFYTEISRLFSLGEPAEELREAFAVSLAAQKLILQMLKPGVLPGDIFAATNAFLEKNGYFIERRLNAHGQGLDLVERPLIRPEEPMKLQAGMNLAIHPAAVNARVWGGICDNYIVTQSGASECLHKTPKEIIVV